MKTTVSFTCSMCQRTLSVPEKSTRATESARLPNGFLICYDCAGKWDVATMIDTGLANLYFHEGKIHNWGTGIGYEAPYVSNWCETLVFHEYPSRGLWIQVKKSKHNIGKTRFDVWFTGPDGARWHGVNIGDNQILRCKRLKKQKKVLTPLKEETYLKPYNYD